ncbi:putative uncharacterized protein DDB_G0282133 isoform X1 [Leptidea sinapis]|uniref:putative uncharacterized protein DDB_G0282133 isoform X1 n=1 Tax=Leptidea sinapis TaxID=189913 RepID=UPI002123CBF3|nr:putative uncharacterized protein DDB_G0282133 isoform X1 [Leptidea sinapis]
MKITLLLFIIGVCVVTAKYLPDDSEPNGLLLRIKRSDSEESNSSSERKDDNDSDDNEDSRERKLKEREEKRREKEEKLRHKIQEREHKEREKAEERLRKQEEHQKKLQEKRLKEEHKEEERKEKEEKKLNEKLEKERQKQEERQRKLEEKSLKEEQKRQEKLKKRLEEIRKEAIERESDTDDSLLETEEENSVEFEDVWRNHIYMKYGLTLASTRLEKQAALDRYLQEELGLPPNSTKSERRRAILQLIQTKLQNDVAEREALRKQFLSHVNAITLQKLRKSLDEDIEELNNKTELLKNITLPWAAPVQQTLEEKRTLLQTISQFLSSLIPNWFGENQQNNKPIVDNTASNGAASSLNSGSTNSEPNSNGNIVTAENSDATSVTVSNNLGSESPILGLDHSSNKSPELIVKPILNEGAETEINGPPAENVVPVAENNGNTITDVGVVEVSSAGRDPSNSEITRPNTEGSGGSVDSESNVNSNSVPSDSSPITNGDNTVGKPVNNEVGHEGSSGDSGKGTSLDAEINTETSVPENVNIGGSNSGNGNVVDVEGGSATDANNNSVNAAENKPKLPESENSDSITVSIGITEVAPGYSEITRPNTEGSGGSVDSESNVTSNSVPSDSSPITNGDNTVGKPVNTEVGHEGSSGDSGKDTSLDAEINTETSVPENVNIDGSNSGNGNVVDVEGGSAIDANNNIVNAAENKPKLPESENSDSITVSIGITEVAPGFNSDLGITPVNNGRPTTGVQENAVINTVNDNTSINTVKPEVTANANQNPVGPTQSNVGAVHSSDSESNGYSDTINSVSNTASPDALSITENVNDIQQEEGINNSNIVPVQNNGLGINNNLGSENAVLQPTNGDSTVTDDSLTVQTGQAETNTVDIVPEQNVDSVSVTAIVPPNMISNDVEVQTNIDYTVNDVSEVPQTDITNVSIIPDQNKESVSPNTINNNAGEEPSVDITNINNTPVQNIEEITEIGNEHETPTTSGILLEEAATTIQPVSVDDSITELPKPLQPEQPESNKVVTEINIPPNTNASTVESQVTNGNNNGSDLPGSIQTEQTELANVNAVAETGISESVTDNVPVNTHNVEFQTISTDDAITEAAIISQTDQNGETNTPSGLEFTVSEYNTPANEEIVTLPAEAGATILEIFTQ